MSCLPRAGPLGRTPEHGRRRPAPSRVVLRAEAGGQAVHRAHALVGPAQVLHRQGDDERPGGHVHVEDEEARVRVPASRGQGPLPRAAHGADEVRQVADGLAVHGPHDGRPDPAAVVPRVHAVRQDLRDHHRLPALGREVAPAEQLLQVRGAVVGAPPLQVLVAEVLEDQPATHEEARAHVELAPGHQVVRGLERLLQDDLLAVPPNRHRHPRAHRAQVAGRREMQPAPQQLAEAVLVQAVAVELQQHVAPLQ
mmetsp:Transcript_51549/g.138905  ORF Transcript_51549/g.138905 Transcript_51549/m.138905 type:complete len:253 (-) Transcript_51549:60-818(-)